MDPNCHFWCVCVCVVCGVCVCVCVCGCARSLDNFLRLPGFLCEGSFCVEVFVILTARRKWRVGGVGYGRWAFRRVSKIALGNAEWLSVWGRTRNG